MEISILLLNYKTKRLLRQCLKGVYRYPPSVPFEVIVVDNGSGDDTGDMVRAQFPGVKFIGLPTNTGYPRGSNVGIAAAKGKYILFLNTDIVVLEHGIDELYRYVDGKERVAMVGPRLMNPDGSLQESAYRFHTFLTPLYQRTFLGKTTFGKKELVRFLLRDWDHGEARPVDWLMSSCVLVRRSALDAVGVFDERFFVYLSDTDLCRRLWLSGFEVHYVPQASFFHYHRRQSAEHWRVTVIHTFDWFRYVWKWRGTPPPRQQSSSSIP